MRAHPAYWVASSGKVTDAMWKEYKKNQEPAQYDDDGATSSIAKL